MYLEEILWKYVHHGVTFLPTMNGTRIDENGIIRLGTMDWHGIPLSIFEVYIERNMVNISKNIPNNIFRTPRVIENVFIGVDCSPEEIEIYIALFK